MSSVLSMLVNTQYNLCSEQNVFHDIIDEVASEYQNRLSYYKYNKQQAMTIPPFKIGEIGH